MKGLRIDWSRVHARRDWTAATPCLALGAAVYGPMACIHRLAYERGVLKARRLPGFVLSVGNLTAGGTGKTPAVACLAQWTRSRGFSAAVLSRGYKRSAGNGPLVVSDGTALLAGPWSAGDEPCLLARRLEGVPVIVGADRWQAGMLAHRQFGAEIFILDDGFQHHRLARDVDLVLLDGREPFGNGHLLPWGPLREPQRVLRRADALILTGCGRASGREEAALRALERGFPGKPVFKASHRPEECMFPYEGRPVPLDRLRGVPALGFAGIAAPERFRETLLSLGVDIVDFRVFPDHHRYTAGDILSLRRAGEAVGARYLLTTEKDWVKIEALELDSRKIGFLRIRFEPVPGEERSLFEVIEEAIRKRKTIDAMDL